LKRYDEALSDLQKSIELDSRNFGYRANGNIGLIYHQLGEYDKALKALEASMSYDNAKADVFYLRGETYTALENYRAAIADYEAAIARFPRYALAYQSLGYAYYKTTQYDKAAKALKQAIEILPDNPTPHFYLALVYLVTDDFDRATAELSQATDSFTKLSKEDQQFIYTRVVSDLKAFAQENPSKTTEAESMIKLMPQPH
jgi:tetratricopeptide (TPR) repeat protein